MNSSSGGNIVVNHLIKNNVDRVFALPGVQLDPLFDALYLEASKIDTIVPRHEQSTTYMADGYYRVSHKPGVAVVVPGPGLLNALSGLATAYACNSRVLIIAGQIKSSIIGKGYGALHEIIDQTLVSKGVVKWVKRVNKIQDLGRKLDEAFEYMNSPFGGPAVIEIPEDILSATFDESVKAKAEKVVDKQVLDVDVTEAVNAITKSQKLMVLAGGGVRQSNANKELLNLAEFLSAPVVNTENSKGVLPEDHILSFERTSYDDLVKSADTLLIVGSRARMSLFPILLRMPKTVIRIDTNEERLAKEIENSINIHSDAKVALRKILFELKNRDDIGLVHGYDEAELREIKAQVSNKLSTIKPQLDLIDIIKARSKTSDSLVFDFTQLGYAAKIGTSFSHPQAFIWPGYQGTLGYSFATAMGAALGTKDRVICVTGDGGFSWTLSELSTLVKYNIPLVTIVMNDGMYSNVRRIQKEKFDGRYIGTDLLNPNYRLLAEAFSVSYSLVDDKHSLSDALAEALDSNKPWLIEFETKDFPSPWKINTGSSKPE